MNEDITIALSSTISRCMNSFENGDLDDMMPIMLIEDYILDDGRIEAEGNLDQKIIWKFIQDFCDAASHRMDCVNEFCTIDQGSALMYDCLNFLSRGIWGMKNSLWILRQTYGQ